MPPSTPFWTFSLGFYARPEVARACLTLQDDHGADVNLVLLAIWLGRHGYRLSPAVGRRLQRLARQWQRPLITPLRQVRRRLKPLLRQKVAWPEALMDVRARIMAAELALERIEQGLLEQEIGGFVDGPPDPAAAYHNLAMLNLSMTASDAIKLLMDEAFSTREPCP